MSYYDWQASPEDTKEYVGFSLNNFFPRTMGGG